MKHQTVNTFPAAMAVVSPNTKGGERTQPAAPIPLSRPRLPDYSLYSAKQHAQLLHLQYFSVSHVAIAPKRSPRSIHRRGL
jgi:hypothetical protein